MQGMKFAAFGGLLSVLGLSALFVMRGTPAPGQEGTGLGGPVAFDLPAPKLVGEAQDWLNTEGKKLEFRKGRVYILHFWTFG